MKTLDKIKRVSVILFVFAGLGLGMYKRNKTLPVYEGIGQGFGGDVVLSVAIDGDRIDSIEVVSHSETDGVSDLIFTEIIPSILDKQHLNVDDIGGATYSSRAIKEAVKDAAAKAGIEMEIEEKVEN